MAAAEKEGVSVVLFVVLSLMQKVRFHLRCVVGVVRCCCCREQDVRFPSGSREGPVRGTSRHLGYHSVFRRLFSKLLSARSRSVVRTTPDDKAEYHDWTKRPIRCPVVLADEFLLQDLRG